MNSFKIIGFTKDFRTNTNVIYAQILVQEYFELIGENYNKFQLQRKREVHRGYKRLKEDLQKGALIPGITLAIEPNVASDFIDIIEKQDISKITEKIKHVKDNIYILDGLQRTHKIKELLDNDVKFKNDQKLLLEIWIEPDISHLVYRLIVLNSGQKPMSMRHQIELLFTTMRVTLTKEIDNLEILVENEESKRTSGRQFPFERLVTAYYSFLMRSPEVDKSSIVSERLIEEKIMDGNEEYLTESFSAFKKYLNDYCLLDEHLFRICDKTNLKSFRNWFADANVINSFFAAIGKLHESRAERVQSAIGVLKTQLTDGNSGEDVLRLEDYKKIRQEVADPKVYNVGYATRLLLVNSFSEYFRDEGLTSLYNCWVDMSISLKKS